MGFGRATSPCAAHTPTPLASLLPLGEINHKKRKSAKKPVWETSMKVCSFRTESAGQFSLSYHAISRPVADSPVIFCIISFPVFLNSLLSCLFHNPISWKMPPPPIPPPPPPLVCRLEARGLEHYIQLLALNCKIHEKNVATA